MPKKANTACRQSHSLTQGPTESLMGSSPLGPRLLSRHQGCQQRACYVAYEDLRRALQKGTRALGGGFHSGAIHPKESSKNCRPTFQSIDLKEPAKVWRSAHQYPLREAWHQRRLGMCIGFPHLCKASQSLFWEVPLMGI